jgi:L-alanine-DL-glutamate epimerase-like enolase superfamily enzyme
VLHDITLYRVRLPLHTPYRLSYRTFTEFEPILVEVRDRDGRSGWGEGHISPGSSSETREGGWAFCRDLAGRIVGQPVTAAKALIGQHLSASKVAGSALLSALEMLQDHPLLHIESDARLALLTPFNATDSGAIVEEVEQRLEQGFATFKIKVGKDVDSDLRRVAAIQQAGTGRATLRLDANRAFDREQGCRFAAALDPADIELFEQPCAAADWDANAAVAAVSTVPLMLDEPIETIADIERAATIDGVGLCKLKLKRFGSPQSLEKALLRVRELGMEPVLGDGLGSELSCWMEACVARSTLRNAGEFNGFLKCRDRLFENPLTFADGVLTLSKSYTPQVDRNKLTRLTLTSERFSS